MVLEKMTEAINECFFIMVRFLEWYAKGSVLHKSLIVYLSMRNSCINYCFLLTMQNLILQDDMQLKHKIVLLGRSNPKNSCVVMAGNS